MAASHQNLETGGTALNSNNNNNATSTTLGYGDLCRFYYRALRAHCEDYLAHNVMDLLCSEELYFYGLFTACFIDGRVLEEKQVRLSRPRRNVSGKPAAQSGHGAACKGTQQHFGRRQVRWHIAFSWRILLPQ